jgi:hypothetical protein
VAGRDVVVGLGIIRPQLQRLLGEGDALAKSPRLIRRERQREKTLRGAALVAGGAFELLPRDDVERVERGGDCSSGSPRARAHRSQPSAVVIMCARIVRREPDSFLEFAVASSIVRRRRMRSRDSYARGSYTGTKTSARSKYEIAPA